MRINKSNFGLFMWLMCLQFLSFLIKAQSNVPTVISKTGRVWMDRNLGASQVATSSTDPLSLGDLYQWGRGTDVNYAHLQQLKIHLKKTNPDILYLFKDFKIGKTQ